MYTLIFPCCTGLMHLPRTLGLTEKAKIYMGMVWINGRGTAGIWFPENRTRPDVVNWLIAQAEGMKKICAVPVYDEGGRNILYLENK